MSLYTLGVDCGAHSVGVGLFRGRILYAATYIEDRTPWGVALLLLDWARSLGTEVPHMHLAIEHMQIYPGASQIDANDLLAVNLTVGCVLAHAWDGRTLYRPREWKGTMKKAASNARVLLALSEAERRRVPHVGAKTHNTIDGVGVGLKALGRLERKRIFPGATQ